MHMFVCLVLLEYLLCVLLAGNNLFFHFDSGLMLYLYSSTFCLVRLKASVLMKSTVLYTVPGSSSLFGVAVLKKSFGQYLVQTFVLKMP